MIYLFFLEQRAQFSAQFVGAFSVHAERFLDDQSVQAILCIDILLETLGNRNEDGWRQRHVVHAVRLAIGASTLLLILCQVVVQRLPRRVIVVQARVI